MAGRFCFPIPKISLRCARPNLATWRGLQPEFAKRNTKIIGLSVDPVTSHGKWAADIEETQGAQSELSDDWRP